MNQFLIIIFLSFHFIACITLEFKQIFILNMTFPNQLFSSRLTATLNLCPTLKYLINVHARFFSWVFPACTLLLDTARLFIFDNFSQLHICNNYFKIWFGYILIEFEAYTFLYLKKLYKNVSILK